jgi:hypothetical protein
VPDARPFGEHVADMRRYERAPEVVTPRLWRSVAYVFPALVGENSDCPVCRAHSMKT